MLGDLIGAIADAAAGVTAIAGWLVGIAGGVVIAWGLQQYGERRKDRQLRDALKAECLSLYAQLPQLIDLMRKAVNSIDSANFASPQTVILPAGGVRHLSKVYDEATLATIVTTKERNLLHVVHETLRVGEQVAAAYDSDIREAHNRVIPPQVWRNYAVKMKDILRSYDVALELLRSFLAGSPKDVFYIDRPEAERRSAEYVAATGDAIRSLAP